MLISSAVLAYGIDEGTPTFGKVKGNVFKFEQEEQTPLVFVKVYALEAKIGTTTDFDGNFELDLPAGENNLVFRFSGLQTDTVMVFVEADGVIKKNVEMQDKTLDVVQVTVKRDVDNGGDITASKETKDDDKVVVVKTRKQLESTGAGDMGEATNKITGLSTVGSVLYVRGLGDRYNVAYMNGLPIPSPNPDFRVVPLSIFPTDIVSSISVSKVMSSELYGDFSGGAFNITTRSYYDKPTLKVSVGGGANTQTTFSNFKTYQGGKLDYLGFDDGTRQIPNQVITNSNPTAFSGVNTIYPNGLYNSTEGQTTGFLDNFGVSNKVALPFSDFSISGGNFKPFKKSKDRSKGYGFIGLLSHDTKTKYSYGSIKNINAQSEERLNYDVYNYNLTTSTTGLFNLYFRFNPNHNLSFNSLFVNTSNDETRETWGSHFDYADNIYSRRLTYKQSFISVNQVIGTHKFMVHDKNDDFARLTVDWRGSYSLTGSQEPDRRQFVAFYNEGEESNTANYDFNFIDRNENHRFFSELSETEIAGKVNAVYVLKFDESEDKYGNTKIDKLITLKSGVDYKSKTRQFDYKQYNYVLNEIASNNQNNVDIYNVNSYLNSDLHDQGEFYIQEVSNFGSSYTANLNVLSAYTDLKIKFNKWEIIPGIRYESGYQSVVNRNQTTPSEIDKTTLLSNNILPSFITKYSLSDDQILRVVASKTLTRPKFNELAPFQYTLFFAGAKAQGNPELLNSSNYNFDVRYEKYPRPGELITIGGFYKYLDKPIEQTQLATASGQLMSFSNAMFAHVGGVEFEYVRNLSFLVKEQKRDSSFLKNFGLGFNASYMFTTVQIDTNNTGAINTNSLRPLEGASPYLVNFDIRYEKKNAETGKSYLFALAYNVFGPRLYSVGSNGIGDQYAKPVSTLNFIAKVNFNEQFSLGFKVKNLLNPNTRIVQEDKRAGYEGDFLNVSSFKRGIDFSISLGYSFNLVKTKEVNEHL